MTRCICGCGQRAVQRHHVCYRQHVRQTNRALVDDPRNLVPVAHRCHERHHSRAAPLELSVLPDSVFEFALELLGPAAYGYLSRRYRGGDPRHDALLKAA